MRSFKSHGEWTVKAVRIKVDKECQFKTRKDTKIESQNLYEWTFALLPVDGKVTLHSLQLSGSTKEIGACLTRIVIRHKSMESRMKTLCSALLDCMVMPMTEKLEDWRKTAAILDKDHSKEYKKLRSEVKKKWETASRMQKKRDKATKSGQGQGLVKVAESASADLGRSLRALQEQEKNAVRKVLIEERSRYCTFVSCLRPVLGEEAGLVSEFQQLEEVTKKLGRHTEDPYKLPPASEQVILDICKGGSGGDGTSFTFQTPPSSPSSLGSRKSSMCSISSAGSSNGSPSHHQNARMKAQVLM